MIIIGAGMAGCLAARAWPGAQVFEAEAELPANHNAVLRFRTPAIGQHLGIPFTEVTVRKGIWMNGKTVQPDPGIANLYSLKCLGRIVAERSIWDIEPTQRWVAPRNFHALMAEPILDQIQFNHHIDAIGTAFDNKPIISTIPLSSITQMVESWPLPVPECSYQDIHTLRGKVHSCDVHQTLYFPSEYISVYRATLTGGDIIIESIHKHKAGKQRDRPCSGIETDEVIHALGIESLPIDWEPPRRQRYGKIAPIGETLRRSCISTLTSNYGIYSLGRFATWRNILLDDLMQDIEVIRRLISSDKYARSLQA